MANSRRVYGDFSVDYVVIRGGKQKLDAYGLFRNVVGEDFIYDHLLDLDSSCTENSVTLLPDQDKLVKAYTQYVTDRLKILPRPLAHERRRVLFVCSSYIPKPLIGITGPRTEMIPHFLNCFGTVYVVNGESLCNPDCVDKWTADSGLHWPLRATHAALDGYTPATASEAKRLALFSGKRNEDSDQYLVYTEDHVTYITMSQCVMGLHLKHSSKLEFKRKPHCEYVTRVLGGVTFVREYHSLESEFLLNKLRSLLSHLFKFPLCTKCL